MTCTATNEAASVGIESFSVAHSVDSYGSAEEELSPSEIVDYLIETGFTEDQLVDVYSE